MIILKIDSCGLQNLDGSGGSIVINGEADNCSEIAELEVVVAAAVVAALPAEVGIDMLRLLFCCKHERNNSCVGGVGIAHAVTDEPVGSYIALVAGLYM